MQQLHRLTQRDIYVEQCKQKMEFLILRVDIHEEPRLTIACFQSALNYDRRDKVELLPYNYFNKLVQLCVRVEEQLKRKASFRKPSSSSYPTKEYKKDN